MKLFLSWSKPRSRLVATSLYNWIPTVVQRVEPWMSTEDIDKGQRWGAEVGLSLEATSQGIICVTAENMGEPWLNFEAGALARSVKEGRVRPVLLDLAVSDLVGPLAQFQATVLSDEEDMFRLVASLNSGCDVVLEEQRLSVAFSRAWSEWLSLLETVRDSSVGAIAARRRTQEDKLDEVLEVVRELARTAATRRAPAGDAVQRNAPDHVVQLDLSGINPGFGRYIVSINQGDRVREVLEHTAHRLDNLINIREYGVVWVLTEMTTPNIDLAEIIEQVREGAWLKLGERVAPGTFLYAIQLSQVNEIIDNASKRRRRA